MQCHKFLISEERSIESLIIEIKINTQSKLEFEDSKVKCKQCGLYFKKGACMLSHKKHKHNYKPGVDCELEKLDNAMHAIADERSVSELSLSLNDFGHYLVSWDGRGLCEKTANGYKAGIKTLFEDLKINCIYDILDETVQDSVAEYVKSESVRISCGIAKHLTALKHLGSYFTTRKRKEISEKKLKHNLRSYKVCF